MGSFSIILLDSDAGYVNRLAAALKKYVPEQTMIYVFCDEAQMLNCQTFQEAVLCCGIVPTVPLKDLFPHLVLYFLQGEPEEGLEQDWDKVIFKYQSVRKIVAQIAGSSRKGRIQPISSTESQQWYGVISPCHHENAEAFAITLAQILGNRKPTLLIMLSEFSGIKELFEIPETTVMEQLVLQLRKNIPQADRTERYTFRLGDISVLCLPENPSMLYELTRADIEKLEYFIRKETEAEAVVWFLGSLFWFGMDLMKSCQKMFCLEKRDIISRCQSEAFYDFVRKGYMNTQIAMPESLEMPVISFAEKGEHLLWQWKNSVLGEEIKKRIGDNNDD